MLHMRTLAACLTFAAAGAPVALAQSATFRDDCSPPNAVLHAHVGSDADADCVAEYDPGGPVIAENWISTVQILTGDVASILILNRASISCLPIGPPFVGGLLCFGRYNSDISFGTHCIAIPNDVTLIGLPVCSQGGSIGLSPFTITLSNALDLVIG